MLARERAVKPPRVPHASFWHVPLHKCNLIPNESTSHLPSKVPTRTDKASGGVLELGEPGSFLERSQWKKATVKRFLQAFSSLRQSLAWESQTCPGSHHPRHHAGRHVQYTYWWAGKRLGLTEAQGAWVSILERDKAWISMLLLNLGSRGTLMT